MQLSAFGHFSQARYGTTVKQTVSFQLRNVVQLHSGSPCTFGSEEGALQLSDTACAERIFRFLVELFALRDYSVLMLTN